jgi:adenylate cyclase
VERRLAAVLAADVVGYSRLIGMDEEGTIARLQAIRRDVIDPATSAHRGRIVKTIGDGILIEFGSVVDALRCAIALQQAIHERGAAEPAEKRIRFRIGVNLGDITVDGDDILGDGVNIAARLESIAQPGSVFLSEDAYRQTRGKMQEVFVDLGERALKNIAHPLRVYAIAPPDGFADDAAQTASPANRPLSEKTSIAVLPFQNVGGGVEDEYFSDGITEDIVTALSRWHWLFVVARDSSFTYRNSKTSPASFGAQMGVRYVLTGSVRKAGTRMRITVQLIACANAASIWTESFDREIVDVFALQDEITQHVIGAIEPELARSETNRAIRMNLKDLSAFDCYQRGMWHFNKVSEPACAEAIMLFRQAIDRDPRLSLGYTGLARALYAGVAYRWSADPARDIAQARDAAQTALGLDRRDADSHFALSGALLYLCQHTDALDEAEKTIALNPNFAFGYFRIGQVLTYAGRAKEAIAPIERSLRHSPYDPQLGGMRGLLALAHFHAGNYNSAAREAEAAVNLRNLRAMPILAASLARLGRQEEAHAIFAGWLARPRNPAARTALPLPYANPADKQNLRNGLLLAAADPPLRALTA